MSTLKLRSTYCLWLDSLMAVIYFRMSESGDNLRKMSQNLCLNNWLKDCATATARTFSIEISNWTTFYFQQRVRLKFAISVFLKWLEKVKSLASNVEHLHTLHLRFSSTRVTKVLHATFGLQGWFSMRCCMALFLSKLTTWVNFRRWS